MKNESNFNEQLVLGNNLTVPKKLYESIYSEVVDIARVLPGYSKCTVEMLCDPDFWNSLSMWERRQAGMIMVYLVRHRLVPYMSAGRLCQSPKVYTPIFTK